MAIAAVRYCLGRTSYIVSDCADWLIDNWQRLPDSARAIIQRDIEEEFRRDDEARAEGQDFKPLGWDCDRAAWAKVRQLWHGQDVPREPHIPTRDEIQHRLRKVSELMLDLGAAMEYAGDFDGAMASHDLELNGAGAIAASWADEITRKADHAR